VSLEEAAERERQMIKLQNRLLEREIKRAERASQRTKKQLAAVSQTAERHVAVPSVKAPKVSLKLDAISAKTETEKVATSPIPAIFSG
jgi:hypothetical protein